MFKTLNDLKKGFNEFLLTKYNFFYKIQKPKKQQTLIQEVKKGNLIYL